MYRPLIQLWTPLWMREEYLAERDARRAPGARYRTFRRRFQDAGITVAAMRDTVTIRFSTPYDRDAIRSLAELDRRSVPSGMMMMMMLLAFVNGELRAALPLGGGEAIADPFHPTAEL